MTDFGCLKQLTQLHDEIMDLRSLLYEGTNKKELQASLENIKDRVYREYKLCMDLEELEEMDDKKKNLYCPALQQLWVSISFSEVNNKDEFSYQLSQAIKVLGYYLNLFKDEKSP